LGFFEKAHLTWEVFFVAHFSQEAMKWIFYIVKSLLSLFFLASASMYFLSYEDVSAIFSHLGFPIWVVYPLATAKILGVLAIWIPLRFKTLKEWAYAGFFFDALLAMGAHRAANESIVLALIAIGMVLTTYFLEKRLAKSA